MSPVTPSSHAGCAADALLLARVAQGDAEAVGQLYDRFAPLVNGVALQVLRDAAAAEDVIQEVFVQVWMNAVRYDASRGPLRAWIYTIARTRALDHLRARISCRRDRVVRAVSPWCGPENRIAVTEALSRLSAPQRRVLELAYGEGLSHSEIAARLGEPLGTVKTRIRDALLRLRRALE